MMRRECAFLMGMTVAVWAFSAFGQGGVRRYVADEGDSRPAIWRDASGQDVLKAEEMARLDGARKLIERIYGLTIEGDTMVYDLADVSKELDAELQREIRGLKDVETIYEENGSCQKKMSITLRTVVEIIKSVTKRTYNEDNDLIKVENIDRMYQENRDQEITEWGSGALPGSEGVKVIQAQRAAEVDCFERLATRFLGTTVTADTTVRDFVLASDRVRSSFVHSLRNVRWTDVRVKPQYVEVDGELKVRTVIERIVRTYRREVDEDDDVLNVEDLEKRSLEEEFTVLKETGKGAYREGNIEVASSEPYYYERRVVERVLRQETVVE